MTAPLEELAGALGRERHLLEYLLFKLVAARHLLAAGETRFLGWSSAEVERAAARVREADEQRATAVRAAVLHLGMGDVRPTLRELARQSPEPLESILRDHHAALLGLVGEITTVTSANRALAEDGLRMVADVVELIEAGIT